MYRFIIALLLASLTLPALAWGQYGIYPPRPGYRPGYPNPYVNPTTVNVWKSTLDGITPNLWASQIQPQLNFLNNPGRLNYFEPKTTFRFTVGKTF